MQKMRHKRIIIWGHKPHTRHTHGYIHEGYFNAAESMGYETHWLDNHDNFDPTLFDDALVITEHWAPLQNAPGMPLSMSSTYFIHYMGNRPDCVENPDGASLYRDKVGRFLDFRYNGYGWKDKNYDYVIDKSKTEKISEGSRFEKGTDGYDIFYSIFATDLLPFQIDLEDVVIPKSQPPVSFYAGTIREDNGYLFQPYVDAIAKRGIQFVWNNTWQTPLTTVEIRDKIAKSTIVADLRGEVWQKGGYIPCRTFKNISYGQLGVTNSIAVNEAFGDMVAFDLDAESMVEKAMSKINNHKLIQQSMQYVKEHHTFVNRIEDFVKVASDYV
jgi:hypothetical protein